VTDYYQALGVSSNATQSDIKAAYKKLSLRHHPDLHLHKGDKAGDAQHDIQASINVAYSVLSDPGKRAEYDRSRAPVSGGFNWQQQSGFRQAGFDVNFGDLFNSFNDIFSRNIYPEVASEDIYISRTVAMQGGKITLSTRNTLVNCGVCNGRGFRSSRKCRMCKGTGQFTVRRKLSPVMFEFIQSTCGHCGGTGVVGEECKKCDGAGVYQATFFVKIPPGMREGDRMFMRSGKSGLERDIILRIHVRHGASESGLGKGWHKEPDGHSRARKYGRA